MHVLKNRDHGARLFVSRPRHRWEQMLINTRPECTEYNPGMRRRGMMDGSGPERGTRQQSIRWKRVPDAPSERAGGLGRGELAVFCSRRCQLALVAKQRLRSFHANQPVRVTGILSSSARPLEVRSIPCSLPPHFDLTLFSVHSSRFASGKTRTVFSSVPIHTIIPTQWGTYYAHASVRARAIPSTSEDHQFFIPRNPCAFFLVAFVAGPTCRVGNLACLMFRSSSSPCLVSRLSSLQRADPTRVTSRADQSSVQVIEQFGKYKRMAQPGFNWCVVCVVYVVSDQDAR